MTNIHYYSPSTKGFYESEFHSEIPSDKIEISEEKKNEILTQHYSGMDIIIEADGSVDTALPIISPEQIKANAKNKVESDFFTAIKSGFKTSIGIKFDCDMQDILNLKGIYDLAQLTGADKIALLVDFDNVSHFGRPVADLLIAIKELSEHYQSLFMAKQAELDKLK